MNEPREPLVKYAIRLAGGPKKLGQILGISHQAVGQWDECPPLRVLDLERLSGVSRHDLRPDIYGTAPADLAEAS